MRVCRTLFVLSATVSSAHAMPVLYASDARTDQLYTINPATAEATVIGTFNHSTVASLTYDVNHNILYGSSTIDDTLLKIDPFTAEVSVVGSYGISLFHGIEYDPIADVLYGISTPTRTLYRINVDTAQPTALFHLGNSGVNSLAIDPISGTMYGAQAGSSGGTKLFRIDIGSRSVSLIGLYNNPEVQHITGLAFDPVLGLFGTDNGLYLNYPEQLFSLDTQTGQATLIGTLPEGNPLGLAFVEIAPEPTSAIALSMLTFVRRRR